MKKTFITLLAITVTGIASAQVDLRWDPTVTLTAVGQTGNITQNTSSITGVYTATEFTSGAGNPDPFEIRGTGNGRLTPTATNSPLPVADGNAISVSVLFDPNTVPDQLFVENLHQSWENRVDQFGVTTNSDLLVTLNSSTWDTSVTGNSGLTEEGLSYRISGNQLFIVNDSGANILGNGVNGPFTQFQSVGSVTGFTVRYNDIHQNHSADFRITDTFSAVPEPSSTALLGLGGLALVLRRKK